MKNWKNEKFKIMLGKFFLSLENIKIIQFNKINHFCFLFFYSLSLSKLVIAFYKTNQSTNYKNFIITISGNRLQATLYH